MFVKLEEDCDEADREKQPSLRISKFNSSQFFWGKFLISCCIQNPVNQAHITHVVKDMPDENQRS